MNVPGPSNHATEAKTDLVNIAFIIFVCLVACDVRWTKLNSLVTDDPGMWLNQIARAARGETPYRDFSWNYPPLPIFAMAFIARRFGPTFEVFQMCVDVLSFIVVALGYVLVRMLLPCALRLTSIVLLVSIGITALTKFSLFSLLTYSPSLLFAAIGLLLVLIGGIREVRDCRLETGSSLVIGTGVIIAALSKPEAALAAFGVLVVLTIVDRRRRKSSLRTHLARIAGCACAVLGLYAGAAHRVGFDHLRAGLAGYGLATFACPWWPTGLGVFGALAALGKAMFGGAAFSLPESRSFMYKYGWRYKWVLWGAVPASVLAAAYDTYVSRGALALNVPFASKLLLLAQSTIGTSPMLLPVMWVSIIYWVVLLKRTLSTRCVATEDSMTLVLLTVPVLMCTRGLFGTTLFPYSEVSAACYPFFILALPYLMWRFLSAGAGKIRYATRATVGLCLLYSILRVAGGYSTLISGDRYVTLRTNSGIVRLLDADGSAEIYRYVVSHTAPSDTLLELPYGGGVSFAAARQNPAFTTEFAQLSMPERYQQLDLVRFVTRPPRLVIAADEPHFGATFGYKANMKCPCPRLVWEPDEPSWDPDLVFPVVRHIEENYRIATKIKSRILLVLR